MTLPLLGSVKRRAAANISFKVGASANGNSTTLSVTIPSTALAGQVALLFLGYSIIGGITITAGPGAGWTQIGTEQQDATEVGSRIYWKVITAPDIGATVSFTTSATSKYNLMVGCWDSVNGTAPVPVFAQASEPGTTDQHVTPSVVNNTDGAWRVDFVTDKSSTGTTVWATTGGTAVTRITSFTTGAGAFTSIVGDSGGPIGSNGATAGLITYDSDVSTAKATMWTVVLAPGSASSNPNLGKIVLGGYNNCTTTGTDGYNGSYPGDTSAHFKEIRDAYMDPALWKVRRSFNGGLPSNISGTNASGDVALGIVPYISVRSDPAGTAAGTFNATITSLAASMPNGSYLTWHHEPENDMTGATFVAAFQTFYTAAKAGNANVLVGPAHLIYQWRSDKPSTTNQDSWYVGDAYCDMLTADVYEFDWQAATAGIQLSVDSGFTRWYAWASQKPKPLCITEIAMERDSTDPNHLGQHTDAQCVTFINGTFDWAVTTGKIKMILWWNGYASDAGQTDDSITPTVSHTAGHPTALAAWNAKAALYGSTSSDIRDV